MAATSIDAQFRSAREDLISASESAEEERTAEYLEGVAEVLDCFLGDEPCDPEAFARPQPWALDTIEHRLDSVAEDVEPGVAEKLEKARQTISEARVELELRHHSQMC